MTKLVYDNRELSWLKFNYRVLEEAQDSSVPLMERLLFASIYCSNLDEFFMVRVGSLKDKSLIDDDERDGKTKMRPSEQLGAIYSKVREINDVKDKAFASINKELKEKNVFYRSMKSLTKSELDFIDAYYAYEIKPFLNALIIDKRHPFPFLNNNEIYVIAKISSKTNVKLGIIGCNGKFDRVVILPSDNSSALNYLLVEDIILYYTDKIFDSYKVEEKALMRITRNADLDIEESFDNELDFRQNMSALINRRKRLCPIRLQLSKNISELTLYELLSRLELSKKQTFIEKTPLDLSYVFSLFPHATDRTELFFDKFVPQQSRMVQSEVSMMTQIDSGDIFLSYPYESMKPFIKLLNEAAVDPDVDSIKITLYRVANNSKVIKALCNAAENGKDVIVLVELRARFDEENNINWSKFLEESGCHVLFGPKSLKVHSKLCLISKKTNKGIKYYTQIGTGNYNEKTAELYTDFCLMTSNADVAKDAVDVFQALLKGDLIDKTRLLLVAPHYLQNRILEMMDREIDISLSGGEGYVGAKLNSLTDKILIDKLIECSQSGVKVELVIRGISCLVAGVSGVTENIRIVSIVGRYLEHSRVYYFGTGEQKKVYISSADYMTRNTCRRIEVAAPILDDNIRRRLIDYFNIQLSDNIKAREQTADGTYKRVQTGDIPLNSQSHFSSEAYANIPKPITEGLSEKKNIFARILSFFRKTKF